MTVRRQRPASAARKPPAAGPATAPGKPRAARATAAAGVQIVIAVPSTAVATRIAGALLDRRLCACAQTLGPIHSRYEWQGKRESGREWLLLIKTRAALFAAVERAVRELHPYELPEIVGLPMRPASRPYLEWIALQTRAPRLVAGAAGRRRPR